jgi:hypothetical protein
MPGQECRAVSEARELGLSTASANELIQAMACYPELIQRRVVTWADRAIIARPPELLPRSWKPAQPQPLPDPRASGSAGRSAFWPGLAFVDRIRAEAATPQPPPVPPDRMRQ